jgi:uncharacterized protein YfaP (DUF2135 family)
MRIIVLLLIMAALASAQGNLIDRAGKMRINDAFAEMESGQLTLRLSDAVTGNPLPDVKVTLGEIMPFYSESDGAARFNPPGDGEYPVRLEKDGYITAEFKIEIMAGSLFFNRFSMSRYLPPGQIRIVLDWDSEPPDLDAHLLKEGAYHISYHHKRTPADGSANLDRDDMDGKGPETITIRRFDTSATYRYYVHNFSDKYMSDSNRLGNSGATVKVYGDNRLLEMFRVPQGSGRYWHVCDLRDGKVTPVEQLNDQAE